MVLGSTPKDDFVNFLSKNAVWIALTVVIIILITVFLIIFLNRKYKTKANQIETTKNVDSNEWKNALGGEENIVEASAVGSRLSVSLKETTKMDVDKLKEFGVKNIISMKDKKVLVISNAEQVLKTIKKD